MNISCTLGPERPDSGDAADADDAVADLGQEDEVAALPEHQCLVGLVKPGRVEAAGAELPHQ
jgi:hypothetical protein